jgi:hypothetical protein
MPVSDRMMKIDRAIGELPIGTIRDLRVVLAIAAAAAQDSAAESLVHDLMSVMEVRLSHLPSYDETEIQTIYDAARTSISFIDHIIASVRSIEDEEPEQDPYAIH